MPPFVSPPDGNRACAIQPRRPAGWQRFIPSRTGLSRPSGGRPCRCPLALLAGGRGARASMKKTGQLPREAKWAKRNNSDAQEHRDKANSGPKMFVVHSSTLYMRCQGGGVGGAESNKREQHAAGQDQERRQVEEGPRPNGEGTYHEPGRSGSPCPNEAGNYSGCHLIRVRGSESAILLGSEPFQGTHANMCVSQVPLRWLPS